MPKTICIYHGPGCADGLVAAWAVHRALGPDVEFVAAKGGPHQDSFFYTQKGYVEVMILRGRNILIVGHSYPLAMLRAMAAEARTVLVIDHHAAAQEDLAPIQLLAPPEQYQAWAKHGLLPKGHNLAAIFDLNRSGAGLAWDYLHLGTPRPRIIGLIENRVLERFRYGDETREFHAVLMSYDLTDLPAMFELLEHWDMLALLHDKTDWEHILDEGSAILRAHTASVASAIAASRRTIRIAGHVVPCANVPPAMASDAGALLCQPMKLTDCKIDDIEFTEVSVGFAATYSDGADGLRHFSIRSPPGGADVSHIARQMAERFRALAREPNGQRKARGDYLDYSTHTWSGGGHEHAAGFDAPLGWEGETP
jgi:hypothetical protein